MKIQCPGDLRPPPGRKSSQEIEIDSETIGKSSKIEKIRKPRKTRQNFRIHRFFDFKYAFSLCWRSKSFKMRSGDQPPRLMICFVSRKDDLFIYYANSIDFSSKHILSAYVNIDRYRLKILILYALRVFPAETRLTVYRRFVVWDCIVKSTQKDC